MQRTNPTQSGRAVFDGVAWRDVSNYHWTALTTLAGEFTAAAMGVRVAGGELVSFGGEYR